MKHTLRSLRTILSNHSLQSCLPRLETKQKAQYNSVSQLEAKYPTRTFSVQVDGTAAAFLPITRYPVIRRNNHHVASSAAVLLPLLIGRKCMRCEG